ncbi:MAG: cation:proton antiporter [Trueperaceae bacterium]|nr:cation:proton antiporter [Trueperaceae bacterium]
MMWAGETTLLTVVAGVSLTLVAVSLLLGFVRVLRGPSLPDRVLALDMIGLASVSVIVLIALMSDQPILMDAAIALALVSFLGTLAFARFIERRDRGDTDD